MTNYKKMWQVTAVYIGTVIGSGFATGKEIVEFFSQFGFLGFLGIIIAGYLFIFFGTKIMLVAVKIQARNYFDFNQWLFGRKAAILINLIFFMMMLGVTSVMLAGAGEVLYEHFGLHHDLGMILTGILAVFVMMGGIKGLSYVNMLVVPLIIAFNLLLLSMSFYHHLDINQLTAIPFQDDTWLAIVRPFAYVAFNLALSQVILVPLAYEIDDTDAIRTGAFLGGVLLTIVLVASHLSLVTFPNLQNMEIPTATIMKTVAPGLFSMYLMVIYGEIFTSIISNWFGIEKQLSKRVKQSSIFIYIWLFTICFAVAQFKYGPLLTMLYPIFGYTSLLFLILLFFKKRW